MKTKGQKHIAIFASGRGSNAQVIIDHFKDHPTIRVKLIVTNNKNAGVIQIAKDNRIAFDIVSPIELKEEETMLDLLEIYEPDLIVLAGFLLLIPPFLIKAYPDKIINIHPALLPKYGGQGMYGKRVHEAVLTNHDTESGMTIHYVNERYDEGKNIYQAKCHVEPEEIVETLAAKIQVLEHEHYPRVIGEMLTKD